MLRHTAWVACTACLSLFSAGCGDILYDTGAFTLPDGEKVNADEIPRNARPHIDQSTIGLLYDGSELTEIAFDTYADADAFYLLLQVQRGWDIDLNLQDTQPFEIRKFVGLGEEIEQVSVPRNIRPLEDEIAEGCQFVDTTEVGMLAIWCGGEFAVLPPDSDEWSYIPDPGEGIPTYVGRETLYFDAELAGDTHPVVHVGGQRKSLRELPAGFGTVEEHWVGPWDGERARIIYRPDLLRLCAAVWTLADDSVREDGCLEFEVPGAAPQNANTIGGSVDGTVLFAAGETNTVERGDQFWATATDAGMEIVGRTSDRGNTLVTIGEDLGGPQIDEYFATTEVTVGEGATFESYTFFELFTSDGDYDFTGDFTNSFGVGEPSTICPDGEGLTTCRAYFNIEYSPELTRVSPTRAWQFEGIVYDARRRLLVRPVDILRGSERDITTTIDPERVIDDYIPLSSTVHIPVWAQRVPGTFPGNVPSFEDLSHCATVQTKAGQAISKDELENFSIDIFDEHVISLQGCQPDDAGPALEPVTVDAASLVDIPFLDPEGPYAWTMDGVVFTRGAPLPISAEMPEVVGGGDGAMFVATDEGWMLFEASGDVDWTSTVVSPAGTAAPRFIANRRYAVLDGGDVYGLDERADVGTMTEVTDPAELQSFAHGALLTHETSQRLAVWSTANDVPELVLEQTGPRTASLLDVSDDAKHLLEQEGDIVRVVQTDEPRQVDLVALGGDMVQSAALSADGTRVLLFTTSSGRPTLTLHSLTDPTASTWTVTSDVLTTISGPFALNRATGEVFYQNGDPPGSPNYRAFMVYGTDGTRTAVSQDSIREVAADRLGNLLWFDPQEVLKRMSWSTGVVEDVVLPQLPEGNLDPDFYLEDGFVSAIALGDWYLYDETGGLERASLDGFTYPLSGGRGVFLGEPGDDVDNAVALWAGDRGADTALIEPYEVALFDDFADQVRAFQLLFSARQEDGALLRAPCVPYRIDAPQADFVTSPFTPWYCAR